MAQFTVTTTAVQDAAIAFFVARGQAATAEELVQAVLSQRLNDLIARRREMRVEDLAQKLTDATETQLGQVSAILEP